MDAFSFFFVDIDRNGEGYRHFQAKINSDFLRQVAIQLKTDLEALPAGDFTEKRLGEVLKSLGKSQAAKGATFKELMQAVRFIVTGTEVGPGMGAIIGVLGREVALSRVSFFC